MKVCKTNKMFKNTVYTLLLLLIISCNAPKNVTYFQGLQDSDEIIIRNPTELKYKPQDIISILVSAADPETAILFNNNTSSNLTGENSSNTTAQNASKYLIDDNGIIAFPELGELKVAGLTNTQVKAMIKQKLKKFIKNPIVTVKLENFRVTILGEVRTPGQVLINNEQITLIEAIGLAGDLNITGMRKNVTVIRKVNNKKLVYKVDLTSKEIFNSPVFHLAQNDIIYIEPNKAKKKTSRDNEWSILLRNTSSILGIVISIILLTR